MIAFLADENFNGHVVGGVKERAPDVDLFRAQDAGLKGYDDPAVLAWAAERQRVVLTHDRKTMIGFAIDRIDAGLKMPGLLVMTRSCTIIAAGTQTSGINPNARVPLNSGGRTPMMVKS